MEIKNNKYLKDFRTKRNEYDFLYLYLDEEFYLDHQVLQEFIDIDPIPKPQTFEEMERIHIQFEYYSQVLQFSAECKELINKEIGHFIAQVK